MKKREFKWGFEKVIMPCIALGIGLANNQPKKEYSTADWELSILFLCFGFRINLQYDYKHPKK